MRQIENKHKRFMPDNNYHIGKINKTDQILQECASWQRSLDFFKQENSYLKTRLSIVVDHSADVDFIASAEHFQNIFVLKDEFITEITQDVKKQEAMLNEASEKKIFPEEKLIKRQQKLRNEIEYLEKDFSIAKKDFNKFLISAL